MATIKLQPSGAVVIKDGKVACGCCELGDCCFYHTQALANGTYMVGDLPDEIIFNRPFGLGPLSLFKGVWFFGNYPEAIISGAFFGRPEEEFEGSVVYYGEESFSDGWTTTPDISEDSEMGLLSSGGDPRQFADVFLDQYIVSGPLNTTVTRVSFCLWQGGGASLFYDGRSPDFGSPGSPAIGTFKFLLNGNAKIGFNNTPVGSYGGGFTISEP